MAAERSLQERYDKQGILPEVGPRGQKRIEQASILCIGAGGLAHPALAYLAAAGVGKIGIVDGDKVCASNLNRQFLFTEAHLEKNKAVALKESLYAQNPQAEVIAYPFFLTRRTVKELFRSFDLIMDGSDNFSTTFLVNDGAYKYNKPFIFAGIEGFFAQLATFAPPTTACYRCFLPRSPKASVTACSLNGVLGAAVGVVGTMMALEALYFILGRPASLGTILTIDLKSFATQRLDLPKRAHCTTCSLERPRVILKDPAIFGLFSQAHISLAEAARIPHMLYIDVREHYKNDPPPLLGALRIPLSDFLADSLPLLENQRPTLLYCEREHKSLTAFLVLKNKGFSALYILKGGLAALTASGDLQEADL